MAIAFTEHDGLFPGKWMLADTFHYKPFFPKDAERTDAKEIIHLRAEEDRIQDLLNPVKTILTLENVGKGVLAVGCGVVSVVTFNPLPAAAISSLSTFVISKFPVICVDSEKESDKAAKLFKEISIKRVQRLDRRIACLAFDYKRLVARNEELENLASRCCNLKGAIARCIYGRMSREEIETEMTKNSAEMDRIYSLQEFFIESKDKFLFSIDRGYVSSRPPLSPDELADLRRARKEK